MNASTNVRKEWSTYLPPLSRSCEQALQPEYEKLAKAMAGVTAIGAIDCDQHKGAAGQYGVRGFPTLKVRNAALFTTVTSMSMGMGIPTGPYLS
eukprot:365734-Chlamydomonas_euryale.AAC.16